MFKRYNCGNILHFLIHDKFRHPFALIKLLSGRFQLKFNTFERKMNQPRCLINQINTRKLSQNFALLLK